MRKVRYITGTQHALCLHCNNMTHICNRTEWGQDFVFAVCPDTNPTHLRPLQLSF